MIYVCSPYSHSNNEVIEFRYKAVCRYAARLIGEGNIVFSPIAHSHAIATHGQMDHLSHDVWLPQDMYFLRLADIVHVLKLPGWTDSYGVNEEIKAAEASQIPVQYIPYQRGE